MAHYPILRSRRFTLPRESSQRSSETVATLNGSIGQRAVWLRTDAAKRLKKVENATGVIWKTLMVAEATFRRLNAAQLLREVYNGTPFVCRSVTKLSKTHLSLLHYRPARLGEPWNMRAESLKALEQRGARPTFWEDAKPYPDRRTHERWLEQQIHSSNCLPSSGILTGNIPSARTTPY